MRHDAMTGLLEGKRSFRDLVDLKRMRAIFEKFSAATGFTIRFLDHPGMTTLIAAGRRDLCTEFHGGCPVCEDVCLKSDKRLTDRLCARGETLIGTCDHGLSYCAAPVVINGEQIATITAGQVLLREPDPEFFKKRAALHGLDERQYPKALKEVPVASEEKLRGLTGYLGEVVSLMAEQGRSRLELEEKSEILEEMIVANEVTRNALKTSEAKYRALFDNAGAGIFIADVLTEKLLDVNKRAEALTGRSREELIGLDRALLHPRDQSEYYRQHFKKHISDGTVTSSDALIERKDGVRVPVQISATVVEIGGRKVIQGLFEDISERKRMEDALKLSELKFRDLAETLPDLVWETDESGACSYVSPKIRDLLGFEAGEALGKSPAIFIFGEEGEAQNGLKDALQKKTPFRNIEREVRHKDGRLLALESSGNPVFGPDGRYRGYRGVTRDITARKRLEDENELKAMLLDTVKDAIYMHDRGGQIVYANEAAYAQLGYTEEEMRDVSFQQLLAPESAARFAEQTESTIKLGKAVFESEHLRADGGIMPAETHAHALELDNETFIMRVVRDITDRKQAERALKESEEKFRVTFENAPIGMCLTDTEGRILTANGALCAAGGYSMEEILHMSSSDFTHPDDLAFSREWMRRIVAGKSAPASIEKRYIGKDGRVISALVSASLLKRAHGTPMGVIIALQDITARKEAERAQRELMKELENTNAEITQFNSLIAHDLQEPLRMVRSYSQLLERRLAGKLDPEGAEFLGYVMNGGRLMQKMLEDLMTYMRAGASPEVLQEVDMALVVDQVLLLLKGPIDDAKAAVTCGSLPVVAADRAQMTHLVQNLVSNALKFRGPQAPRIAISCEASDGEYVFKVSDNGIGIAPQFSRRVFKIFQRLHTREKYPGTGVGLALCKKIIENHCGRIWVESEPGKGSDFYFSLPKRAAGPAGEEEAQDA